MEPRIIKSWDEMPYVVFAEGEAFSTRVLERKSKKMEDENRRLRECLEWALGWIDAVPSETPLPTMPGFDRDYVDSVLKGE